MLDKIKYYMYKCPICKETAILTCYGDVILSFPFKFKHQFYQHKSQCTLSTVKKMYIYHVLMNRQSDQVGLVP